MVSRSVWILGVLVLAFALAGCKPRQIVPRNPLLLLSAEREAIQYRRLVLPNQLKVMLVSNPRASRSAAAMAVGVGSLSDPKERPGLSHFLEHMLFLGTENYPEADSYSRFMASHAGGGNAYTADDHTNYFFAVSHDAFEEGLDRFAQFFIAPLFDPTYAEREMNAVDSEHAKNVERDYWRTRQVQSRHYRADHPINRFSTGNLETLRDVGREELLSFYRSRYSSNLMTLAVVGNVSLDELEARVRPRFGRIVDRNLSRPRFPEVYLRPQAALRLLRIQPVADQRLLVLHFPMPPSQRHYDAKPLRVITSILGNEGEGSLLSLLKQEDLASTLSAGGSESTADYASVELSIGLTPKGQEHYEDVIAYVLGAIEGLRRQGVPRYLYEENRVMAALDYRFREVPGSAAVARRLSALMQSVPLEDLPDKPFLLSKYDTELYRKFLRRLTPDNMLVTLVAKGVRTDQTEHFYGARFSYEEQTGAAYGRLLAIGPDPRWHLPAPNRFIPERVVLRAPDGPLKLAGASMYHLRDDGMPQPLLERLRPLEGETYTSAGALLARMEAILPEEARRPWLPALLRDSVALPVRLLDIPQAKVWYLPDWRIRQPKAEIILKFHTDGAYDSPRRAMLAKLYEAAIEEDLNEWGYPIKEAGLGYGISEQKGALVLTLSGYSARMLELLQVLVERLQRIELSDTAFASIKERMARGLINQRLDQPYRQSRYFSRMLLRAPNFTREALLEALEPLNLADVQGFAAVQLRRTYLEGVVVGNLPRDVAAAAVRRALDTLGAEVLPASRRVKETVLRLPPQADWVYSDRLAVNNSLMHFIYQVGQTNPTLRGALLLIARPMGERFHFRMRTQQQLGYIAWAGMGQMRRMLNLTFLVQSGQYPADVLQRRMEAFMPEFIADFKAMGEEDFERYRRAVILAKLRRPKSLEEVASQLFWVAFRHDGKFDHISEDIAAVEALTRQQVEQVLVRYLRGEGKKRLAIRLLGRDHAAGPPKGKVVTLPATVRAEAG
ncbi:MAG: insulinase family protein [SAR324 cluster bacterium]|nr:insulinase family protein [SAR324 cluster bacterium]